MDKDTHKRNDFHAPSGPSPQSVSYSSVRVSCRVSLRHNPKASSPRLNCRKNRNEAIDTKTDPLDRQTQYMPRQTDQHINRQKTQNGRALLCDVQSPKQKTDNIYPCPSLTDKDGPKTDSTSRTYTQDRP